MARMPLVAMVAALSLAVLAPVAARADVGAPGPSIAGSTAPTGQKPQSKLWFNDGSWWAILYRPSTAAYEIFRDDGGTWTPTGTEVDARHNVYADALWDGAHLDVVAATMALDPAGAVRFSRFSYDAVAGEYRRDVAPVALSSSGVEAAVVDRDGAGTLWATFTHDSQVWVAHSTTDDATWSAPSVLPVAGADAVSADDISSVVRYGGHVGVMFSNQNDWTFVFASHADGDPDTAWTASTALAGAELSDDHINLKALEGDPAGRVFAAVKTSLNAAGDPLVELLWLDAGGAWHDETVFTVADEPTRPQVVLDPVRRRLHVVAAIGPCCTGGTINVKSTSLDAISFGGGAGTELLASDADTHLNNPTTTKQAITRAMPDLPVLAADDSTHVLWDGRLSLPPAAAPANPGTDPGFAPAPANKVPVPEVAPAPAHSGSVPEVAPAAAGSVVRPVVARLWLEPAVFRRRTRVHVRLTAPGRVTLRIERRAGARWVRLPGAMVVAGTTRDRSVRLARRLRPGRYRLVATLPGAPARRAAFTVRR